MDFVHLHVHSEYSLLDGSIKVKKLVKELVKRGAKAAALTDHDGLHGVLEFYLACQAEGLHGVIGYEINIEPLFLDQKKKPTHLILLAETTEGYTNLIKLCTLANTVGQNSLCLQSINVTWEQLAKHATGLICLTGCLLGELAQHVAMGSKDKADSFLKNLVQIFGPNHTFVELIDNGLSQQKNLIPQLVALAQQHQLPIVATADVHYLDKKDKDTHLSLLAIKHKLQKNDVRNMPDDVFFHMKTPEEMQESFAQYPQALANTVAIAQRCQITINTKNVFMPDYRERPDENADDCLRRLSEEGLKARKPAVRKWMEESSVLDSAAFDAEFETTWGQYEERLAYELSVIISMKFAGYFLIVQDFINWAKSNQIPVGPGRGSAAGSLVTYALRITNIDPIRFHLLFERFLNPERISMPDIDTDFCQDRRDDVLKYVYKKYGKNAVSQIVTFGRMMAKNALKNLARISGWSFHESNEFAKLIPESPGVTLEQACSEEPKIQALLERDERARNLWEGSLEIEGTLNSLGIHAAGVIISDRPLDEHCPLMESEGQLLTQFEHKYAEKVGLIKFDFLGLKTLTVLDHAVKVIQARHAVSIDLDALNLDDPRVYQMLSTAHVTGLFQLESMGMRKLIADLKPSCFTDIIAILALFRPGPLGSGMVEDFVKRKHGQTQVEYFFPQLEPILADTYGVIVYQEQVQKIASVLANYTLGEADLLRRAMGKKDKHEMEKQKNRFVSGATANSYDPVLSGNLFDLMGKFAEYGFNKSHTAAYGLVTFQTAWLKTYYPAEFMVAIMTCDMDNTDKIATYIRDCQRLRIPILTPCVNQSEYAFSIGSPSGIRFGLGAIKGLGRGIIQSIVEERQKNGPFYSVPEFIARVDPRKLNKKSMECLVKSGALDALEPTGNRALILANIDVWLRTITKEIERKAETSFDIFSFAPAQHVRPMDSLLHAVQTQHKQPWAYLEKLRHEYLTLGCYLSGHPADFFKSDCEALFAIKIKDSLRYLEPADVPEYKRKPIKLAGVITQLIEKKNKEGKAYLVFFLEDGTGTLELTLFHKQYEALLEPLKINDAVLVVCKLKQGIEAASVRGTVQEVHTLAAKRIACVKKIILRTQQEFLEHTANVSTLKELLSKNPGQVPVFLDVDMPADQSRLYAAFQGMGISPTDEFLMSVECQWAGLVQVDRSYG